MLRGLHHGQRFGGVGACLLSVLLACSTGGFRSVGPRVVPRDRFEHGNALSLSGREQLLSNLVRLRYLESPIFLDVSTVINQYARGGQARAALGFGTGVAEGDTQTLGGATSWSDRPTITYVPLSGARFSRSILMPINPESLFALVQSGWPAEGLLALTVTSINGLSNDASPPLRRRHADPAFWDLLRTWGRLRDAGVLAFRVDEEESSPNLIVVSKEHELDAAKARDLAALRSALNLDASTREYRVVYALVPTQPNEIAIMTRSPFEVLLNLAWCIDVPEQHIVEGRTGPSFKSRRPDIAPVIRARCACDCPCDAYVRVGNRGVWFYVDDKDMESKRAFAFIELMLRLADRHEGARGPVVSIGN